MFSIGKNYKHFKNIFYLCEEYFACMDVCVPHSRLVHAEGRRGCLSWRLGNS